MTCERPRSEAIRDFFICEPRFAQNARERRRVGLDPVFRLQLRGKLRHGDIRPLLDTGNQESPVRRQLAATARAAHPGRIRRSSRTNTSQQLDRKAGTDIETFGCGATLMARRDIRNHPLTQIR